MTAEIQITGLRELRAAFKQIDKGLPKELRLHFKEIAEQVVGRVRSKLPHGSGEAAAAIKPRATTTFAAIVRPQSTGVPWKNGKGLYYNWLDFGGSTGRGHIPNTGGGAIKRRAVQGGRYLYPTIAEMKPEIEAAALAAVVAVAEQAGFEVR